MGQGWDVIPYIEVTRNITAIHLMRQSFALTTVLREIAAEENAAGRGMLTAIVVYNSGDMQSGPGFFDLAGRIDKNTNDTLQCWIKEVKRVHGYWSKARGKQTPYRRSPNNHELKVMMVG